MNGITVIGVGWDRGQLTLDAIDVMKASDVVVLHTDRCGCAQWLKDAGIAFESLDALYDEFDDFDVHADAAAETVIEAASRGSVAYAVSDIRDRSVSALFGKLGGKLRVLPGPPVDGALLALAQGETRVMAASDWEDFHLAARDNTLIREIDTRELAAEIKLRLMEVYPEESDIWLLQGNNAPVSIPLYTLDRADAFDHRTCVLVPAQQSITELERYDFEHLNEIIRRLCAPDGCPWDRAQTHASLRTCLLEEAYEVIDAIDEGDTDHLYDELGDLLMQVAIHAEIARRHGEFDISDVTTAICEKLISRHTHVFGEDQAQDVDQVLKLWDRNKMVEQNQKTHSEALRSVMRTLPAMLRAVKVLKRSADAGLADEHPEDIIARCICRLQEPANAQDAEKWLGEVLFELAGLSRLMKVDPEIALNAAVSRFIDRFKAVERDLFSQGMRFERVEEKTLRKYWHSVKL